MSAKEIARLKSQYIEISEEQLQKLIYERTHDVSEERFILRRIPQGGEQ